MNTPTKPANYFQTENYTLDYFRDQLLEFRKLFCSKTFWAAEESVRDNAVKALAFVCFNLAPDVDVDTAANLLDCTITEYSQRELMMAMLRK